MAKKPMKPVNAPGAAMRSPLAPTNTGPVGPGMSVDDASAKVVKGALRPARPGSAAGLDQSIFGSAAHRGRTATSAKAQYRITAKRTPYAETYPGTLAGGRLMSPVMGQSRNFAAES